ncbi:MCE family protein [Tenggerimyces flavus]|uniref:MCE family protein n=1 Tax=Tenggerimyces flavus TaxID=1708749 RepID=A0ABV7YPS3_9ACTN|nr:MCE family protein [Tenggerimyces flavus]MBM7785821.1 phospholipid/cholesterol/gamma-HCH transport system substrate-binding protein [Tenggerimyces flavus]
MRPFRERSMLSIGAAGLAVLGVLVYAAFNADDLPVIGGGTKYAAQFTEAGGIRPDDEVRVAGVKVGHVETVELDGDHVRVGFKVEDEDTRLGTRTGAAIRIKTVLGRMYLSLEPAGPGHLDPKTEIPRDRTVAPYNVVEAFTDLTETTERIDTGQLATALGTLSDTFENTPDEVRDTLNGLSRLSRTIATRDEQLRTLLENSKTVTKVLSDRDDELVKLLKDGDLLLKEIQARRELIHQLLVTTQTLSTQLTGLVADNRAQLEPALRKLAGVVALLRKNQASLDKSIELLAPFVRVFANTLGTGPWFDTYIPNLAPLPAVPRLPGQPAGGAQ